MWFMCAPGGVCCSTVYSRMNVHIIIIIIIIINVSLHTTDAAGRQPPVAAVV